METASGWIDTLLLPLRGIIAPIYDQYRLKQPPRTPMDIPAWAVSDIKNTPVPFSVEHRYDFGNGGVYGPPDMPVSRGIVNTPSVVQRQAGIANEEEEEVKGFYNGPQKNMELFVYSPFSLPTDLPCSTSMLKY